MSRQIKLIQSIDPDIFEVRVNNYLKCGKHISKITYRTERISGVDNFLYMAIVEYEEGLR